MNYMIGFFCVAIAIAQGVAYSRLSDRLEQTRQMVGETAELSAVGIEKLQRADDVLVENDLQIVEFVKERCGQPIMVVKPKENI